MTTNIKPIVKSVKQSYVTNNNAYKQSLYSASRRDEDAFRQLLQERNTTTDRIKSAIFSDRGTHFHKEHPGVQNSYPKFRPVTSHPTTSLLASFYKQQSFAESRNTQAAAKLPNITNNWPTLFPGKSNRDLKPFANPSYSLNSPSSHNQLIGRKLSSGGPKSSNRSMDDCHNSSKVSINASDTWNTVHNSILANGQGIFHETTSKTVAASNTKSRSSDVSKNLQNAPSVNYIPFYEVRGRGDGASVVESSSIDVEGKKIVSAVLELVQQETKQKLTVSSSKRENSSDVVGPANDGTNISRKSDDQSSFKITESNEEAPSSFVSSLQRPKKNDSGRSQNPNKIEKKVRFSGTITTNKISEEPSYTEALISSMQKSFKQHNYLNTVHRSIASNLGATELKDVNVKENEEVSESIDASSRVTGEEDDPAFVTPVMKVVVTKRETPAGTEHLNSNSTSPKDGKQQVTSRQVSAAASRIINNQTSLHEKESQSRPETRQMVSSELIRKGTQATHRASTAGYGRRKEAIAKVVKLVPKRQTVIKPNFTKSSAWPNLGQNFLHPSRPQKYGSDLTISRSFSASVQGNNFIQQPTKEIKYRRTALSSKENLKNRLAGTGPTSYYLNRHDSRQANSSRQSREDQNKITNAEIAATPLVALPTTENVSQIALLSPRLFTDFQPIPSMPDHINFCDPRKTELILNWLEDVNKKRNVESRLRRVGLPK